MEKSHPKQESRTGSPSPGHVFISYRRKEVAAPANPIVEHLRMETLLFLLQGKLSPEEQALAEAHLDSCLICSSQWDALNTGRKTGKRAKSPPPEVLEAAADPSPEPTEPLRRDLTPPALPPDHRGIEPVSLSSSGISRADEPRFSRQELPATSHDIGAS